MAQHPEYGRDKAQDLEVQSDPEQDVARPIMDWPHEVRTLFDRQRRLSKD